MREREREREKSIHSAEGWARGAHQARTLARAASPATTASGGMASVAGAADEETVA